MTFVLVTLHLMIKAKSIVTRKFPGNGSGNDDVLVRGDCKRKRQRSMLLFCVCWNMKIVMMLKRFYLGALS